MSKVVKLKDIKELPVSSNGNELRFNCPFCLEIRGKADNDAKLYYNEKKRIGHCWKCDTKVVGEADWSLETAVNKIKVTDKTERVLYDLSEWSHSVTKGSRSYDYLRGRSLTDEIMSLYQFRESDHFDGVIIPNPTRILHPRYLTNFCQIRYFTNDTPLRYLGVPESKKPIYGRRLVEPKSKLIICEGVFSAVAAYRRTGLPSVALYGKAMSTTQEAELRRMNPSSVILMLDGKELRDTIELGKRLSHFIKTYAVFLPYGKDPEEAEDLRQDLMTYCMELNPFNIATLNNIRYSYRKVEEKWDMIRNMCKRRYA